MVLLVLSLSAQSALSQETNATFECDISEDSNYSESLPVLSILNGCSSARKSINVPSNGFSICFAKYYIFDHL